MPPFSLAGLSTLTAAKSEGVQCCLAGSCLRHTLCSAPNLTSILISQAYIHLHAPACLLVPCVRAGVEVLADMPAVQKPFTELLSDILELVRTDLEAFGSEPDEQLLMGLARVAAITGDPDKVCARVCAVV